MGESHVDHLIGHLITESTNPTVGVLAHPGQVDVRIAAKAPDRAEAAGLIAPVEGQVRKLLGRHVFAADRESMEDSVGELLRRAGLKIAVYEDITGGMVAERFQMADPDRLVEGVIAGGPDSARRLLEAAGADSLVSDPELRTRELARALRTVCRADLGLAVHGIPDPEDQSRNLAKGKSFFCVTDGRTTKTSQFRNGRPRPAGPDPHESFTPWTWCGCRFWAAWGGKRSGCPLRSFALLGNQLSNQPTGMMDSFRSQKKKVGCPWYHS